MDRPTPSTRSRSERRRRRIGLVAVLVVFFLVIGGVVTAVGRYRGCKQPPASGGSVTLEVPSGATGRDVAAALKEQGLVRCGGFLGNLLLRGTGKANAILAGTYTLTVGMPLEQIVTVITTPPAAVPTVRLTVPEGLRISHDLQGRTEHLERGPGADRRPGGRVLEARRERPLQRCRRTCRKGASTEGFLFPDTYQLVKKGLTADVVIRRMLQQFDTEAAAIDLSAGAKRLGLTPYEVVIVASMIEREAQMDEERPLVASVIYNRIAQHMTLGHRRDAAVRRSDAGRQAVDRRSADRHPVQHADQRRVAADPDREPGACVAGGRPASGGHPIPLLRAVSEGRRRRAAIRHDVRAAPAQRAGMSGLSDPAQVSGGTRTVGIIGWPVEHSLSPAIHNAAFAALALDWIYVPLPVPPGSASAALAGLRSARLRRGERHDAAQGCRRRGDGPALR